MNNTYVDSRVNEENSVYNLVYRENKRIEKSLNIKLISALRELVKPTSTLT